MDIPVLQKERVLEYKVPDKDYIITAKVSWQESEALLSHTVQVLTSKFHFHCEIEAEGVDPFALV